MGCGQICHKDHLLHSICYEAKVDALISDGYLCNLRSKVGESSPDLAGVRRQSGGDYIISSLSKVTNKGGLIESTVAEALRIIAIEKKSAAIFFCVDIEHCHAVSAELKKHGINAPAVTGNTKQDERDRIADGFKSGRIHAICNVNVYTEGFNATCVDTIVLLRPTLSAGLFSQMVGRGLRLHPSKGDCLVLDFAGCIEEHGPIDALGGEPVVLAVCGSCRESFSRVIRVCPQCGWEIPKREVERLEQDEKVKRKMHGTNASKRSILSKQPETYSVTDIMLSRHCKPGSPDSIVVRYRCGVDFYREWICLDHPGFPGAKARSWWREHVKENPHEISVNTALTDLLLPQKLKESIRTITVRKEGKYKRVIDYNRIIA